MNTKMVIFDFNRTIYDPEKNVIIDGVIGLLQVLYEQGIIIILVSRDEGDRKEIIEKNNLKKFFNDMYFVSEKSVQLFQEIIDAYEVDDVYVVGDYLPAEIRCGNLVGAETIWICAGEFSEAKPQDIHENPRHTVCDIKHILPIIL